METEHQTGELGYGGSLPVPSVQEIVRNDPKNVPEIYIQSHENRPLNFQEYPLSVDVPIIDHSLLTNLDKDEQQKLNFACKEWGFFQIINHGAESSLRKMKEAAKAFFDLPLSEKMKYAMAPNDVHGYGQAYVVSQDQRLDWNDILVLMTFPQSFKNMKYWPLTIHGFKEAVEEYSEAMERVTETILTNLSLLMSTEGDLLNNLIGEMKLGMRMNYYPFCARPDLVLGISPHSDSSAITLLVQDDDITGLQIKHMGSWVPINPVPNAIVVNIGDVMEAWSNGLYKSIEHRAVTNEKKSRISVATFVLPGNEVQLNPLQTMFDDENCTRNYKNGVKYVDYLTYTLSRNHDGKANIEYLKMDS